MSGNLFLLLAFLGSDFQADGFLKLGYGARAVAMGGAYTALSDDPEGVFWNPAGLCYAEKSGFSVMGMSLFDEVSITSLGSAFNFRSYGVVSLDVIYLGARDIERDAYGRELGEFTNSNIAVGAGFSRKFYKFSTGMNVKFIYSKLGDYTAQSYYIDAGVMYDFRKFLFLGLSLRDLGLGPSFNGVREKSPATLRGGAGLKMNFLSTGFILASDVEVTRSMEVNASLGGEVQIGEVDTKMGKIIIRSGYNTVYELGSWNGFTVGIGYERVNKGVGYRIDMVQTDYGFLGESTRASFTLNF